MTCSKIDRECVLGERRYYFVVDPVKLSVHSFDFVKKVSTF